MLQPYPVCDASRIDEAAIQDAQWVQAVVSGIRNIRGEMNIAPNKPLPILMQDGDERDKEMLEANTAMLKTLARIEDITWLNEGDTPPDSATALVGDMKVLVPLGAFIDKDAELQRLQREMDKLNKDLQRATGKLSNPSFVDKAPTAVVDKERQRVTEMEAALASLTEQAKKISAM
jgi:valyl-tRNA synthetase